MKLISFFLHSSRRFVILSLVAGAISGATHGALLAVINAVLRGRSTHGPALLASFIALCFLLPISRFVSELYLNKSGQEAFCALRMQLSRLILAAPLRHLEQVGQHRLLGALTEDIQNIANATLVVPLLCVNASLVIACLLYMGYLSRPLLAIVLGFMAFGIASYKVLVIKARRLQRLAREQADLMLNHFRALTLGIKELKMHTPRRNAFLTDILDVTTFSLRDCNVAGQKVYSAASSWGQTLVFILLGVMIFVLPHIWKVEMPTVIGFALALLYLITPLQVMMNMLPNVSRANVSLAKLEELGFTLVSRGMEEAQGSRLASKMWESIEFMATTHSYRREGETKDFILGPVDVNFYRGEIVFIIGGNGSGKTTFAKLLTGLYAPERGWILVDGGPITDKNRENYRQEFAVVFSDFHLFEQLLGLGGEELDIRARYYLEQLKLSQQVDVKDGKFTTTELSQGQRKRLALLTAYLEDRPIYLFDEWAADQDVIFKNIFYRKLLPELKAKDKTVFVISHDEKFYDVADRIIKLEDGQIVSDLRQTLSKQPQEIRA